MRQHVHTHTVGFMPGVYEISVSATDDDALALQEPIARTLCHDEWHNGPCEVPWGFSADDAGLLLGIYATAEKAAEVADGVRAVVGDRTVELREGAAADYPEVVTQYEIEYGGRAT